MTRLRICMVTTFYPPYHFGGDAVFTERLAHALARDGNSVEVVHDVDAFRMSGGDIARSATASPPGVTVHPLHSFAGPLDLLMTHQLGRPLMKARRLRHILARGAFDVIHYHNISLIGGPGVLAFGDAIKLCTIHEYWLVCPTHVLWRYGREACTEQTCVRCTLRTGRPPQLWRYTGKLRKSAAEVDRYLAPSRFAREALAQRGFNDPIRLLPHFLPATVPRRELTSRRRPYFLFVGRLETLKGVEELVDIFLEYRNADLVIAGSGSLEQQLRHHTAAAEHIQFAGWLSQDELRSMYSGAIATIVPSLCYETFGLVALESIAAGTPAIVRNIGALPEVVDATGGGVTFATKEELLAAMEKFRSDASAREKAGTIGAAAAARLYSEEEHLRQYYSVIEEARAARAARQQ